MMNEMMTALQAFWKDEDGAQMVEYALLVALIGILLILTLVALTGGIWDTFSDATVALGGTAVDEPTAP